MSHAPTIKTIDVRHCEEKDFTRNEDVIKEYQSKYIMMEKFSMCPE